MTISEWLFDAMKKLGKAEVDSPRRDALVLLEDVTGKDRAWVLSHPENKMDPKDLTSVNKLIARRVKREPLAYIRGKAWFYGRFFDATPDVLIPRPETENFINLALQEIKLKKAKVLDMGCGSGGIGITIKLEKPDWTVTMSDVDDKAIEIAKQNITKHKVDIEIIKSDLFNEIAGNYDAIMANLPYVPDGLVTSPEISAEPKTALFAGKDGLDIYRKFWEELYKLTKKPKYILLESLESQHMILAGLALETGYLLIKTEGLVQLYEPKK